MSVPPPQLVTPTDGNDLDWREEPADHSRQYELKCVQALRGREGSAKAKWQNLGWELVSEDRGKLRTELTFRRVKPKTIVDHLASIGGALRRVQPSTQKILLGTCALVLIVGIAIGTQGGGDASKPIEAPATAPIEAQGSDAKATSPTTAASDPAGTDTAITDTTVDELVDKLNAGELKLGDRFRVNGLLVGSEFWGTGASGDYFVTLNTTEGSDLIVFVDEAQTKDWRDGTKVEMVLEDVEATINGETTDGWMRAQSAKTISR